jgi:hypothetical protein
MVGNGDAGDAVAPDCQRAGLSCDARAETGGAVRPQGEIAAFLRQGAATRRFPAWSIRNSLDHHDEQYTAFIPSAQPAHAPPIQVIAHLDRPAKPQELRLNMHSRSGHACLSTDEKSTPRSMGLHCPEPPNRPVSISVVNQQAIGSNPVWRAKYNPTSRFSPPSG